MLCPAVPLAGLNDAITGGPVGATATVVDADVDVDVEPDAARPPPPPALFCEWWDWATVVGIDPAVLAGGADVPPASETMRAMAAATTRAATTATVPISQRSGPARSGPAGGRPSSAE